MIKFRLLLVAAALVSMALLGNAYYWNSIVGHDNDATSIVGVLSLLMAIPAPLMFLSALVMIAFSFLKVEEREGQLVYDARNPYWRLMNRFYDWGESVSLCRAYWGTVFSIFLASTLFSLIFMTYVSFQSGRGLEIVLSLLYAIGVLVGVLLCVFILVLSTGWLENMSKSANILVRYVAKAAIFLIMATLVSGCLYALFLNGGVFTIVLAAGALLAVAAVGFVVNVLRSLPDDYFLMRMFYSLKEGLCPIIVRR